MNGLEHHDAAQELLERARAEAGVNGWGDPSGGLANQLAAAQVHASLAIATFFAPADEPLPPVQPDTPVLRMVIDEALLAAERRGRVGR